MTQEVRLGFRPDDSFRSLINIIREDPESPIRQLNEEKEKKVQTAPQNMRTIQEPEVNPEDISDLQDLGKEEKGKKSKPTSPDSKYAVKEEPENKQQILKDSKQEGDLYLCNNCFRIFRSLEESCPHCFSNIIERIVKEELDVPEQHQRKIAISTLKMSDAGARIAGGMTKEEARAFLKKHGWPDERIAKLEESKIKEFEVDWDDEEVASEDEDFSPAAEVGKSIKVEEEDEETEKDWDYTFRYSHNQIGSNPLEDKFGNPIIWHTNPRILGGKKIRVFTNYQENWAKDQGAIPVRETPSQTEESKLSEKDKEKTNVYDIIWRDKREESDKGKGQKYVAKGYYGRDENEAKRRFLAKWKDAEILKVELEKTGVEVEESKLQEAYGLFLRTDKNTTGPMFGMNKNSILLRAFDEESDALEYARENELAGWVTSMLPELKYNRASSEDLEKAKKIYKYEERLRDLEDEFSDKKEFESKLSEAEDISALQARRLEIEQQMLAAEKEYMAEQNRMSSEVDALNQQIKAAGGEVEKSRKVYSPEHEESFGGVPESKNLKEQEEDNVFTGEAELNLHIPGAYKEYDYEDPKKVSVSFRIEEDYRSWGLKDINVSVVKPISFEWELIHLDGNGDEVKRETKEVTIDPSIIKYHWSEGAGIGVSEVEVEVDLNGKVKSCEVTFFYWNPER